ncbi:uncharacterized protein LOC116805083 [Drosophila grimshawi]|uniref:uncharacterized protein LOC116805083 n=1 Tax=Drosophila grimshawi TaxID=7222 RepID=UPI000C87113F|nr:uncharacterized protein LOC116805083 [Drosophila grimshawi]
MSIPNLMQNVNRRMADLALMTAIMRQMEYLKSCCYFFDLKLGCKLIAVLEAFSGLWQIYHDGKELYGKTDPLLAPEWLDAKIAKHGSQFNFFMGLIGFFSSQLLLAGVIFERKLCVLLWIYVTALVTLAFMFYTLIIACIPELLIFDVSTIVLQAYFIMIAVAYYMQMRRAASSEEDAEVLFTAREV